MSKESPTEFLERKHPVVKLVVDYCLKRMELLVVAVMLGGGTTYWHLTSSSDRDTIKTIQQQRHEQFVAFTNSVNDRLLKLEQQQKGHR